MKITGGRKSKNSVPKLVKGKKASTGKGFAQNIKREAMMGRGKKQAVAVAYAEADRGMKKKKGKK